MLKYIYENDKTAKWEGPNKGTHDIVTSRILYEVKSTQKKSILNLVNLKSVTFIIHQKYIKGLKIIESLLHLIIFSIITKILTILHIRLRDSIKIKRIKINLTLLLINT